MARKSQVGAEFSYYVTVLEKGNPTSDFHPFLILI